MIFIRTREETINALLRHFLAMPAGKAVTYSDLSRIAGEKVGPSFYPLRKAIVLARDRHAVLIRNERGVGFVRSGTFDERRDMLDGRRGKVRRQALTGLKETACRDARQQSEERRDAGAHSLSRRVRCCPHDDRRFKCSCQANFRRSFY